MAVISGMELNEFLVSPSPEEFEVDEVITIEIGNVSWGTVAPKNILHIFKKFIMLRGIRQVRCL